MKYFILIAVVMISTEALAQKILYPATRKVDQVDNYFGTPVADPYRWLENSDSADVGAWVASENSVTEEYLSRIPYRAKLRARMKQLYDYPRVSAPHKVGDYYFFLKNSGLQNQAVLYRQHGLQSTPEVFLDPNTLSPDGTSSLGSMDYSNDNKYLAYTVQKSGSDWQDIFVKEVATGKDLTDHIEWARYTNASWFKDGFFYGRYDAPKSAQYTASSDFQKIYYHKLGTPQSDDKLIYQDPLHGQRSFFIFATEDERYLFLYQNEGGQIGALISWKLADLSDGGFKPLIAEYGHNVSVVDNIGDEFLLVTDEDAPTNRAVLVDPEKPGSSHYQTIIPAKQDKLEGLNYVGGKLIATYLKDASNRVYVYGVKGNLEKEIALPTFGSVVGFSGKRSDAEVFYMFSSFITPPIIYRYDLVQNKSVVFHTTEVPYDVTDYVTEQVFYESKDGTRIPMFLVHKKGIVRNGKNPVTLMAYGGFNISLTPYYMPVLAAFLERGFIFAQPNIRGGGEYGKQWHEAGMKLMKQNVFDDFIAAAEYLFKKKYTSPEKLCIEGGSNGGLLVGAVMCQHPDICKVAIPVVGVMDMLRYHKFTIGWGWASEYGTSDDSTDFENLYKYSPLHNLKKGVSYPATLVRTADHDDRVVPAHSFKFIASLQEKQSGDNPVLISIETKAGHGFGKPLSKYINEIGDQLAFTLYNMGWKEDSEAEPATPRK
jgi:prolyl oligopeptidase